jgi:hypothetical protein
VKLDATYIKRIAHAAVFDAVQLERVIRFAICAQSTVCGLSFFIRAYERNAFIVPDAF